MPMARNSDRSGSFGLPPPLVNATSCNQSPAKSENDARHPPSCIVAKGLTKLVLFQSEPETKV
jgi:hypothetical protein